MIVGLMLIRVVQVRKRLLNDNLAFCDGEFQPLKFAGIVWEVSATQERRWNIGGHGCTTSGAADERLCISKTRDADGSHSQLTIVVIQTTSKRRSGIDRNPSWGLSVL